MNKKKKNTPFIWTKNKYFYVNQKWLLTLSETKIIKCTPFMWTKNEYSL